jgi:type I restriction enzyme S subunit
MFGNIVKNNFKWPSGRVSDLVAKFESGKSFAADADSEAEARHRILKVSAVTSGYFLPTESKPVPRTYNPPSSHFVQDGDLIFSRANTESLIGATALASSPPDNLLLPDKLWRFVWHKNETGTPLYIRQLFRQAEFRREITRRSSGTSGSMKNISQPKVLSIECGIPPMDLRHTYSERVKAIEILKSKHSSHLAELDTLFVSLQDRAFRGKLWNTPAV